MPSVSQNLQEGEIFIYFFDNGPFFVEHDRFLDLHLI